MEHTVTWNKGIRAAEQLHAAAEQKLIAAVAAPTVAPPAPAATPSASVRSHYTRKQRVARCSKIAAMLNIGVAGCLLEVQFAGFAHA